MDREYHKSEANQSAFSIGTPLGVFIELVKNSLENVRHNAACHPSTPAETLFLLVEDNRGYVRLFVADNFDTSNLIFPN